MTVYPCSSCGEPLEVSPLRDDMDPPHIAQCLNESCPRYHVPVTIEIT